MNMTELQTFIFKFHQLWEAGVTAHLNLDTHAGQAWVGLRVQLGQAPGPGHEQPRNFPQPRTHRSPSYYRRQERRKAAKAADDAVEATVQATDAEVSAEKADCGAYHEKITTETSEIELIRNSEKNENLAVQAEEHFCEICDFKTNWKNGLNIHMSRKHGKIEQVDGNYDDESDEEYISSKNYWKSGQISTVYQTFLDVNKIIEDSDLSEREKHIEKQKVLEARREAFGESLYKYYPPWSTS